MGVCRQNSCYHVAAFRDSISLDMQHDHVLKKLNFDLLTRSGASVCVCMCVCVCGGGGSADKIFATMLLHFVIPFNLICNMTMF